MRSLSVIATAAAVAAISSCTTSPQLPAAVQADQQVQQMIAGKVASAPTGCIPSYHSGASTVIAPNAIAFRVDPGTVYLSDTSGSGCAGLAGSRYALVTQARGSAGLCRGDIVQVRDLQNDIVIGSCALGDFVRYSRP